MGSALQGGVDRITGSAYIQSISVLEKRYFFQTIVNWHFFLLRLEEENDEYENDEFIKNYYHLNPPPPGVSLDIIKEAKLNWKKIKNKHKYHG